jgi:predicted kinase
MTTFREFVENRVVILRGISGAGKSTYIRKHFPKAIVVSADHYFQRDGEYKFDATLLPKAHGSCLWRFQKAVCQHARLIVVDNTNTQVRELAPYADFAKQHGYAVEVIRLKVDPEVAAARNIHGVPADIIQQMQGRFEDYPGEKIV